jgi:hypothetical protein
MDTSGLSDYQLYEIIQNKKLHTHIRIVANKEFNKRNISINELREIVLKHESISKPENDKPLMWQYKLLLVICPFFTGLLAILASRFLANGEHRKWKAYWLYICLGYTVWTIVLLTLCKFVFFKP